MDKLVGGATGATISDHIKECYSFLCNNWQPGDEIFLFGFSRGAYTARAISTLINDVGLLTAKGMEYFGQIFEDWKDQNVPDKLKEQEREEEKHGARGAFLGMARTPPMPSQRYVDALVAVSCPSLDVTIIPINMNSVGSPVTATMTKSRSKPLASSTQSVLSVSHQSSA